MSLLVRPYCISLLVLILAGIGLTSGVVAQSGTDDTAASAGDGAQASGEQPPDEADDVRAESDDDDEENEASEPVTAESVDEERLPEDTEDDEPPASEESSTDADEDTTDVGEIEAKVGSTDGVLLQLENAAQERDPLVVFGPLSVFYYPWRDLNTTLDESVGLRLGFTYFSLLQHTTPGPETRTAASGDLDFFGRWTLLKTDSGARGILGFNIEDRHAYTDIPPSSLNQSIGSIVRTTRGFTDSGFNVNELWWDQRMLEDRFRFRLGTINQKHYYDLHRFKSQKRYFLGSALSDSPTIAFPSTGPGAVFRVSLIDEVHVTAGIGDANGDRSVGGYDRFFQKDEYFTAADVDFTPEIDGLGRGRYSVTFWHIDARSEAGIPSGQGFSVLLEQEMGKGVFPFVRYGYGEGANLTVEHLVSVGLGAEGLFGQADDAAGIGASWARPPGDGLRDQWGVEAFYRFQISPALHLTPGFQVIVNPSLDPSNDVIGVFELRLGIVF